MASILDTVWGTGPQRAKRATPTAAARPSTGGEARRRSRLTEIESFGADPGSLRMLTYAPKNLAPGAPLVVVLHGCSQNAAGYDLSSGWSALADELGFVLLYPEQRRANNPGGCFNWFLTADSARGLGEARSIREMVETLIAQQRLDRGRIFVVGLSAGGAMAANLLAGYPDVFSAGAVIAGLPCGAAANVQEAFEAMSRPAERTDAELGDAVRAGAPYEGPWPRISIWQGLSDRTVAPGNADQLVRQWLDVHGAKAKPATEQRAGARLRRVWRLNGRDVVEATTIEGLGHGTPLDASRGERSAPFMLDVGVSSTRAIADFFGLAVRPAAVVDDAPPIAEEGGADDEARPASTRARRGARAHGEREQAAPQEPDHMMADAAPGADRSESAVMLADDDETDASAPAAADLIREEPPAPPPATSAVWEPEAVTKIAPPAASPDPTAAVVEASGAVEPMTAAMSNAASPAPETQTVAPPSKALTPAPTAKAISRRRGGPPLLSRRALFGRLDVAGAISRALKAVGVSR